MTRRRSIVVLLTVVALELVRSSGPLLDMAFAEGVVAAAGAALATYAAPGAVAALLVGVGGRFRTVPGAPVAVGVGVLVALRLAVQGLEAGARFGVGLATVAVGIAVLTLAVDRLAAAEGGVAAARAVATGLAASVGLQLALGTWDAYWRHDVVGWGVVLTVLVALVVAVVASSMPTRGRQAAPDVPVLVQAGAPGRRAGRLWALGPALGLAAMTVANPAYLASQTGTPLAVAGACAALGWLLAAATAGSVRTAPTWGAVVLAALVAALVVTTAWPGLVLAVATPPALTWALARALEATPGRSGAGHAAGAATLVGLGTILPLLVYQLDYDVPLGVPNRLVLVVTAGVVGLAGLRRGAAVTADAAHPVPPGRTVSHRRAALTSPLAAAAVLAVVGTALAGGRAVAGARAADAVAEPAPGDEIVLVDWNLHYGVDPAGDLGLEQIARTIEAQDPDVVALQEVSRGWVMGGGADAATWLADRLGMHVAFAPAADRQFGNAVLTALPVQDVRVVELPYGEGPQRRSALVVDLEAAGQVLRVTSVHLQHREENTATRLDQLDTLLAAVGDAPSEVVAGDLNAEPGWAEIERFGAEWTSAVDVAGDPASLTFPSTGPVQRIDWVLGRGVAFVSAEVPAVTSSDHLPVVVRFHVPLPGPQE